ncbi:MAG: DUF2878 domain-containing protein [Cellvibrionaceae bacterium]
MNKKLLINFSVFQSGWFVCVLAGNIPAIAFTVVALFIHHLTFYPTACHWRLISAFSAVGIFWDSLLVYWGVIQTNSNFLPIWLACLWVLFSTTLVHSFKFLHKRLVIGGALAALFAPLTYFTGTQLSTASLPAPLYQPILFIGFGWALLFPVGLYAAARVANPAKRHPIQKAAL